MSSSRHSSSRHSSSTASSSRNESTLWQQRLEDACLASQMTPPVFQIVSDRRGGRTAWSSRVTIAGTNIAARFWYDGKNLNNAKEDAAEMALTYLTGTFSESPSSSRTGSSW